MQSGSPKYPHIIKSDQDVLFGLYDLVAAYRVGAMKSNRLLLKTRQKKAELVEEKWREVLKRIDKGIASGIIHLPFHFALYELRRLMQDEDIADGKFTKNSLKSYLLGYYLYLEKMAKAEFDALQADSRTKNVRSEQYSYQVKTPVAPEKKFIQFYNDDVKSLTDVARKKQYHDITKKQIAKGKYTPGQVYQIALHALHSDLNFDNSFTAKQQEFLMQKAAGHQFIRSDGVVVKYFYPVRDADVAKEGAGEQPILNIKQWLEEFGKNIDENELIIVPLMQIQHGRAHFNTIVIYQKHIYIIEPRSTNLTREGIKPILYPTKAIGKALKEKLGSDYTFKNIFTGQQALFNDIDCGAHHLNYVEKLYTLTDEVLTDKDKLRHELEKTQLARRLNDETILKRMDFLQKQSDALNPPEENDEPLTQSEEEEESLVLVEDSPFDNDSEAEAVRQSVIGSQLEHSRENKYQLDIKKAADNMQAYIDVSKKTHSFFHPHTRDKTAKFLKSCAESLSVEDRSDRFVLSMLFYACYVSIHDKSSSMRAYLEKSLINLLDCPIEYMMLKENALVRSADIERLFAERLQGEMMIVKGSKLKDCLSVLNDMKIAMKKIDEIDTSLLGKIASKEGMLSKVLQTKHEEKKSAMRHVRTLMDSLKGADVIRRITLGL